MERKRKVGELIATIGTERTKVDKAMIIVAGTKEKLYIGNNYYSPN